MSLDDEIYFETREESLREIYEDFLYEEGLTEEQYPFLEFCWEM